MQRLLNAVTALSLALYVVPPFVPLPALAQATDGSVPDLAGLPEGTFTMDMDGQSVICLPAKATCPEGAVCVIAKKPAGCEKKAAEKLAEIAAAEGAVVADTGAAASGTEAPAEPAPAPATEPTVEPAPAPAVEPTPVPATEPAPEPAVVPEVPAVEAEVTEAPEPGVPAADDTATAEVIAAEPAPPAEPEVTDVGTTATADAATTEAATAAPQTVKVKGKTVICLPLDKSVTCPDGSICVRPKTMDKCEAAATKKLEALAAAAAEDKAAIEAAKAASDAAALAAEAAGQELIDAPKPTEEAVKSLDAVLVAPPVDSADASTGSEPATEAPPVAAAAAASEDDGKTPAETAVAADAVVTEEEVTAEDTRASDEEFAAAPATTADGSKKTGLSDLERAGLLALGALAIGQMLYGDNGGSSEVVSNSGDRVVVKDEAGTYQVYKDDDVLLRQPGSTVRTETFNDGSTRTTVMRDDGSSVVTIRDASGRVLRRSSYDALGIETALIDDTIPEKKVNVSKLPPATQAQADVTDKAYLHAFSLRQIRTIPEVKALARPIKVDNVTFETGSAAIRPNQAENLADLAAALKKLIKKNPNKVFLIEGHTDAVGNAPSNLTLSDRRAESVAKALIEYYGLPPENLVVQGYGEAELLIDTQGAERANRRVLVRDITPLLRQSKAS